MACSAVVNRFEVGDAKICARMSSGLMLSQVSAYRPATARKQISPQRRGDVMVVGGLPQPQAPPAYPHGS